MMGQNIENVTVTTASPITSPIVNPQDGNRTSREIRVINLNIPVCLSQSHNDQLHVYGSY